MVYSLHKVSLFSVLSMLPCKLFYNLRRENIQIHDKIIRLVRYCWKEWWTIWEWILLDQYSGFLRSSSSKANAWTSVAQEYHFEDQCMKDFCTPIKYFCVFWSNNSLTKIQFHLLKFLIASCLSGSYLGNNLVKGKQEIMPLIHWIVMFSLTLLFTLWRFEGCPIWFILQYWIFVLWGVSKIIWIMFWTFEGQRGEAMPFVSSLEEYPFSLFF